MRPFNHLPIAYTVGKFGSLRQLTADLVFRKLEVTYKGYERPESEILIICLMNRVAQ